MHNGWPLTKTLSRSIMRMPTFRVVFVSEVKHVEDGFTNGWAVIRTAPRVVPQFASRLYWTQTEAEAESKRLSEEHALANSVRSGISR